MATIDLNTNPASNKPLLDSIKPATIAAEYLIGPSNFGVITNDDAVRPEMLKNKPATIAAEHLWAKTSEFIASAPKLGPEIAQMQVPLTVQSIIDGQHITVTEYESLGVIYHLGLCSATERMYTSRQDLAVRGDKTSGRAAVYHSVRDSMRYKLLAWSYGLQTVAQLVSRFAETPAERDARLAAEKGARLASEIAQFKRLVLVEGLGKEQTKFLQTITDEQLIVNLTTIYQSSKFVPDAVRAALKAAEWVELAAFLVDKDTALADLF